MNELGSHTNTDDDPSHDQTLCDSLYPRCEASNSANLLKPVSTRISFNVFFSPRELAIELERPERNHDYDRTKALKETAKKFADKSYKVVMAGELIRLNCQAGEKSRVVTDGQRAEVQPTSPLFVQYEQGPSWLTTRC